MTYTVTVELNETEYNVLTMYNNNVLIKDIKKQLHLSHYTYQSIFNKLKQMGLINERPKGKRKNRRKKKGYSYNSHTDTYTVYHAGKYFGCVKTEKQAKRFIELLKGSDWDYSRRDEFKKKAMI